MISGSSSNALQLMNTSRDVVRKFIGFLVNHVGSDDLLEELVRSIVDWQKKRVPPSRCMELCQKAIDRSDTVQGGCSAMLRYFQNVFCQGNYDMELTVSHLDYLKRLWSPISVARSDPPMGSAYFRTCPAKDDSSDVGFSSLGYKVINNEFTLIGNSLSNTGGGPRTRNKFQSTQTQRDVMEGIEDELVRLECFRESALWFCAMLWKHQALLQRLPERQRRRYSLRTVEWDDPPYDHPDIQGCHLTVLRQIYTDKRRFIQIYRLLARHTADYLPVVKSAVERYLSQLDGQLAEQRERFRVARERTDRNSAARQKPGRDGATIASFSGRALLCSISQLKVPAVLLHTDHANQECSTAWLMGTKAFKLVVDVSGGLEAFHLAMQLVCSCVERALGSLDAGCVSVISNICNDLLRPLFCSGLDDALQSADQSATVFVADDLWYIFIRMFTQVYRTCASLLELSDPDILRLRLENVYDRAKSKPLSSPEVPGNSDQCMQVLMVSCVRVSVGDISKDEYDSLVTAMYGRKAIDLVELPEFAWSCGKQFAKILAATDSMSLLREFSSRHLYSEEEVNNLSAISTHMQTSHTTASVNVSTKTEDILTPLAERYIKAVLIRHALKRRYFIVKACNVSGEVLQRHIMIRIVYASSIHPSQGKQLQTSTLSSRGIKRKRRGKKW